MMASKLKLLTNVEGDRSNPLEWLESIATSVEVDKSLGITTVRAELGKWGDIRLQVWGKGDTIARAAQNCADRVGTMLDSGNVTL